MVEQLKMETVVVGVVVGNRMDVFDVVHSVRYTTRNEHKLTRLLHTVTHLKQSERQGGKEGEITKR